MAILESVINQRGTVWVLTTKDLTAIEYGGRERCRCRGLCFNSFAETAGSIPKCRIKRQRKNEKSQRER
jgi:hypothetical protein